MKRNAFELLRPSPATAGSARKKSKGVGSTTFVVCPSCKKSIPSNRVNSHLDKCLLVVVDVTPPSTLLKKEKAASVGGCKINPLLSLAYRPKKLLQQRIPGLFLAPDFLTKEEERDLLEKINKTSPDWKMSKWNGACLSKHWGVELDVVTRVIDDTASTSKMPPFLNMYIERMCQGGSYMPMAGWKPNECNSNKYIKAEGHFLSAHFDDRQLSGELLANISLQGDAEMVYKNPKTKETVTVYLPRRSLQIVTKESRYSWTHGIPHASLRCKERVSLTFRCQGSRHRYLVGKTGTSKAGDAYVL